MIQRIMAILKLWAKTLESKIGTDGVYVFGSLIYRDGQQFGDQSDIDLVVRFPYSAITALDRLYWLESLHAEKRKLEAQLSGVLKRNPDADICSMVVPTAIELYADLHKDGQTDSFFSENQFFDLLMEIKTVGIAKARDYPIADPLVVQCLRFAQKKRNQYLGVSASGVTRFSSFDGEDPIPKEFMRHAAIASSIFMPGSEVGAAYDVQFGLDFVSNGLYRIRNTDRYIEGLHDRLSIRRKARPARGQVITPQDQLFLAEWIFDQALEALCLKDYARERLPERTCRDLIERVSADLQQRGWSVANLEMGQGCTNPSLNARLVASSPLIPLQPIHERWLAYVHHPHHPLYLLAFALAEARKNGGDVFNGRKIRLACDFAVTSENQAIVQETDYFSSLMTDQLAWRCVRSKRLSPNGIGPEHVLWDGTSAFIEADSTGSAIHLKGLGEATISNQLGASTLAFSSDGHLMIVYQNKKNQQSKDMLAPSGSGSLDWADISASGASDLLSLIAYGAERELREECALDEHKDERGRHWTRLSSKVIVTGFARMLHRGGKPEFFCLGRIAATSKDICARDPERYVEYVIAAPVKCANWSTGRATEEISRVCRDYLSKAFKHLDVRIPLSYPLEHALRLLVELCEDERAAPCLNRFMQEPLK